ncbi:MAG: phosphoenolpyruvate carboxykinase (GTP), partial [Betaproteobacteria bacterium]|nr:phosphoenolpyruvate carboxykinase (GTP) [Betaproteobacteria bacterium]
KDASGKFIWPGFGENMRVLEWIVKRCHGGAQGVDTALGIVPRHEDMNWRGLERFARELYEEIVRVDPAAWKKELAAQDDLLGKLGARLPDEIARHRAQLREKLAA